MRQVAFVADSTLHAAYFNIQPRRISGANRRW
jgi:hypothetical protein